MAATPQYCVLMATGSRTGMTYSVDMYLSDVANEMANFDAGAGAGASTPDFYTFPEPVVITDIAIHTGMADTTKLRLVVDGKPTGHVIRYATNLDSLSRRPALSIGILESHRLSAIQLA